MKLNKIKKVHAFILIVIIMTVVFVFPLVMYMYLRPSQTVKLSFMNSSLHSLKRKHSSNVIKPNQEKKYENSDISKVVEAGKRIEPNRENSISTIVEAGKQIQSKTNNTVLVTLINDAYLSFTYSWLCNTKSMDIHKQVLFITTDTTSRDKLNQDWPDVTAVALTGLSVRGDQVYSHTGYVVLMIWRTEVLLAMLNEGIEIFLFEVDCLWIKNPFPMLKDMSANYDILVSQVSERPGVIAGGFLYMRPTAAMKTTWQALTSKLLKLYVRLKKLPLQKYIPESDNDQMYLSSLVMAKHGGLTYKILTVDVFADGKWYSYPESKRKSLNPVIINNNWALGNKAKIDRAKKWSHWFLLEDNKSCDLNAIKKIVKNLKKEKK